MATVTIKDIAEQLGVSPATISLALNGRPGVNEETRLAVLNLANRLGYRGHDEQKGRSSTRGHQFFNLQIGQYHHQYPIFHPPRRSRRKSGPGASLHLDHHLLRRPGSTGIVHCRSRCCPSVGNLDARHGNGT